MNDMLERFSGGTELTAGPIDLFTCEPFDVFVI
jgi:hypothetical protein